MKIWERSIIGDFEGCNKAREDIMKALHKYNLDDANKMFALYIAIGQVATHVVAKGGAEWDYLRMETHRAIDLVFDDLVKDKSIREGFLHK